MKTLAIAMLLAALAVPAAAGVIWDEGTDGDLSTNAAAPTPITFATGSSTIKGTVSGTPLDRDYITFTIDPGKVLTHLWLHTWDPDDIGFSSFNAGSTSFVPSGATNALFLSGIHLD